MSMHAPPSNTILRSDLSIMNDNSRQTPLENNSLTELHPEAYVYIAKEVSISFPRGFNGHSLRAR